jgi:hypothetical protein
MADNATMMVHAPWTYMAGNSADLREQADVLDTWANAMATSYASKSKRPQEEMLALLTDGKDHWYTAAEAQAMGFVDTVVAALPLAAFNYLHDRLPSPQGQRLYMDRGTTELDALYGPYQSFVDEIVRDRGWGAGQLMSQVFEGTGHSERAWAARLEVPLLFLMGR